MIIKIHKFCSILCTSLWLILGMLTIGSIAASSLVWIVNLGMGLLFIIIGVFIYLHGMRLHLFYASAVHKLQKDPNFQKFLRLDLIFVIISCLGGGVLLIGALIRVFMEGFAVFG